MEGVEERYLRPTKVKNQLPPKVKFPMALPLILRYGVLVLQTVFHRLTLLDVANLTREYIKDGLKFNDQIIYPDFRYRGSQ